MIENTRTFNSAYNFGIIVLMVIVVLLLLAARRSNNNGCEYTARISFTIQSIAFSLRMNVKQIAYYCVMMCY